MKLETKDRKKQTNNNNKKKKPHKCIIKIKTKQNRFLNNQ